ncbi:hypothetical protein TNCV_3744921 [Trichonephila clavipes]|nr:hypothetical protein TNCV_3744921 [Trichonephila clavipes]
MIWCTPHSFESREITYLGAPAKSPSEGPFPFLVTCVATVGHSRCDWASVEDLGSVCIEHMILSCLGESSCPYGVQFSIWQLWML